MIASTLLHSAFYKFTPLQDPDAVVMRLRALTQGPFGQIFNGHTTNPIDTDSVVTP